MRPLLPPQPPPGRAVTLARLASTRWDLVVVGGGATGCAVAREAARQGLTVALVEQDDLASGTSSRSSRLIHGGLRYLAQGDLGLVREGLRERGRLLHTAPGLVRGVDFAYPIYRGDPDGRFVVGAGLTIYDFLSWGHGLGRHRRQAPAALAGAFPGLRREGLQGGFVYRDAATHDARLTVALALAAAQAGALIVPRCRALAVSAGTATVEERVGGSRLEVQGRAFLIAGGPWPELLPRGTAIRAARGAHLAVPSARLPLAACLALRSPDDGRLIFALPAGRYSVLGTTDVEDREPPETVHASRGDVEYLLRAARHFFPDCGLEPRDVTGLWAGLRPLLADPDERDPDRLSRRHLVVEADSALFALVGGKLTTHRAMAEDAVARIAVRLGTPRRPRGAEPPLLEGSLAAGAAGLRGLGLPEDEIAELAGLYGARLERLAEDAGTHGELERAQVALAAGEEWAWTLDDLLLRRLLPGALDLRLSAERAPAMAELLGEALGWSGEQRRAQAESFRAGIAEEFSEAGLHA